MHLRLCGTIPQQEAKVRRKACFVRALCVVCVVTPPLPQENTSSTTWFCEKQGLIFIKKEKDTTPDFTYLQFYISKKKMMIYRTILLVLAVAVAAVNGFAPGPLPTVNNQGPFRVQKVNTPRQMDTSLQMGKQAKFGVFSPAVYGAKVVLGTDKLNKIRGKAISLHSQYIGEFCEWAGAYHLRTRLIKKAKTNGDILGFLV